jgi:hypothetical protein
LFLSRPVFLNPLLHFGVELWKNGGHGWWRDQHEPSSGERWQNSEQTGGVHTILADGLDDISRGHTAKSKRHLSGGVSLRETVLLRSLIIPV